MDKKFTVNNNCTGCGICEKVCPVDNIEILNNKPQYKHHCEQQDFLCFAAKAARATVWLGGIVKRGGR
ncbi:MAG: 4Fe-4S binding protein [Treponema sp.]|nr:4Fe-4S binding protein [Treponema sp.]